MERIWNIVTCRVEKFTKAAFLNIIESFQLDDPPDNNFEDYVVRNWQLERVLNQKNKSAKQIMDHVCNLLLDSPQFELGDASTLSYAMLRKDGIIMPLSENQVVYDILLPNLCCVLMLEAIGQKKSDNVTHNLVGIMEESGDTLDYTTLSHLLSKFFPKTLRDLFAVEEKATPDPYKIGTKYSRLFLAELAHIKESPLSENEKTGYSHKRNKKFYDKCLRAICPDSKWTMESFAEYYLFERFFRLNTKNLLFQAEFQSNINRHSLSPALFADFFYSSPLVLFPSKLLQNLFYPKSNPNDSSYYVNQMCFLHFLIQLSSYWFPVTLYILRLYMRVHSITDIDKVNHFLFTDLDGFSSFEVQYAPSYAFSPGRNADDLYRTKWKAFAPSQGYCAESLLPLTLREWAIKKFREEYNIQDAIVLRSIQDTLYE